jgi:uncharacterized membrane protein YczE
MVFSGLVIGSGVYFAVTADIGTDPMTTFQKGLSKTLNLDLALCSFLANVSFAFFSFIVDKKSVKITDIIYPFLISVGIKLSSYMNLPANSIVLRAIYFAIALIVIGLGIGLGANSRCGNNPYDGFSLLVSEKTDRQFKHIRLIVDIIMLVIGISLKGNFGIGTFISMLLQGTIGQFFIETLAKSEFINKIAAE